jgi:hypothetical protein
MARVLLSAPRTLLASCEVYAKRMPPTDMQRGCHRIMASLLHAPPAAPGEGGIRAVPVERSLSDTRGSGPASV